MRIASVPVFVSDQEQALTFYRDRLGFKVIHDIPYKENGIRWLTVAPAESEVEIILFHPEMSETPAQIEQTCQRIGQWTGIILETDDIHNTYQTLKTQGVDFQQEPTRQFWGGWNTSIHDPDGNILQLIQPQ